jgi:thiosulfate reductase cytochrome b subunit
MVGGCVVSSSRPSCGETMITGARATQPRALAVRRHHLLVRISHWLCAYLFMLNGLVYLVGLCIGGGWRSLLPRLSDARGVLQMTRYYLSLPYVIVARRQPIHPSFRTIYNPLQRLAYFSVAVPGLLAVATGWAIHKPAQLSWLTAIFGGFDNARVWHFWLMVFFMTFVIPHVVLVIADGWDTLRSMITGWSTKLKRSEVSDHEP